MAVSGVLNHQLTARMPSTETSRPAFSRSKTLDYLAALGFYHQDISAVHSTGVNMSSGFFQSRDGRPWSYDRTDAKFEFYQGEGSSALEIVVVDHGERPNKNFLQRTYTDRRGGRVNPILVVALYDDKVGLCGPSGTINRSEWRRYSRHGDT